MNKKNKKASPVQRNSEKEIVAALSRATERAVEHEISAEVASHRLAEFQPKVPISFIVAARRTSREKHL